MFVSCSGKTSTASLLSSTCGFKHIDVGLLIKDKGFHKGIDEIYGSFILDEDSEDLLCDELEDLLSSGGCVVDFHSCSFMPERWFNLIIVLRASNSCLFDRLTAREYNEKKIQENIQAEILQVCLDEAQESWPASRVVELTSESVEQMEENVQRTVQWIENYMKDQKNANKLT